VWAIAGVATVGSQLAQTVITSRRDPVVLLTGFGSAGAMLGVVQTSGLSQLFGCTPLDPCTLAFACSAATGVSIDGQILPGVLGHR
jgi:hypothetical protein